MDADTLMREIQKAVFKRPVVRVVVRPSAGQPWVLFNLACSDYYGTSAGHLGIAGSSADKSLGELIGSLVDTVCGPEPRTGTAGEEISKGLAGEDYLHWVRRWIEIRRQRIRSCPRGWPRRLFPNAVNEMWRKRCEQTKMAEIQRCDARLPR